MFGSVLGAEGVPQSLYYIEAFIVLCLGLAFGSFASAMIHRIPLNKPWARSKARSACPVCDQTLGAVDLIPVLSWSISRGKCRHCAAPIPAVYPLLEVASGLLCLLVFFVYSGTVFETYLFILAVPFLLSLFIIDIRYKILPNQLVLILALIGGVILVEKTVLAQTIQSLQSVVLGYVGGAVLYAVMALGIGWVMKKMLRQDALGMGDVKFFAVAGLWLGVMPLGVFCMLSGFFGVVFGVLWRRKTGQAAFPFGPALIMAFFVLFLFDGSFFLEKALHYIQL